MFIMQSDIIGQQVQSAIVRESFWDGRVRHRVFRSCGLFPKDVMFGYEVPCAGMETACQEAREDEVVEGVERAGFNKKVVECALAEDVDDVIGGEGYGVYEDGTDGVKEDLEGAEEGFSKERIKKEGFESGWEVGVETINAEGFVVREVVGL